MWVHALARGCDEWASCVPTRHPTLQSECKYVPSSRVEMVESALYQLQQNMHERANSRSEHGGGEVANPTMDDIDEYLEMMYETEDSYKSKVTTLSGVAAVHGLVGRGRVACHGD